MDLKNAVAFAYGDSKWYNVRSKQAVFLGDIYLLYLCKENENADHNTSRNTVTVKMADERNENGAMDMWSDYSKDVSIEED